MGVPTPPIIEGGGGVATGSSSLIPPMTWWLLSARPDGPAGVGTGEFSLDVSVSDGRGDGCGVVDQLLGYGTYDKKEFCDIWIKTWSKKIDLHELNTEIFLVVGSFSIHSNTENATIDFNSIKLRIFLVEDILKSRDVILHKILYFLQYNRYSKLPSPVLWK